MKNAAHELANLFESLRAVTGSTPLTVLRKAATEREVSESQLLRTLAKLIHQVDVMIEELRAAGVPVDHFDDGNNAWTQAVFRFGPGWVDSNAVHADNILKPGDLALLKAFGGIYDFASRIPRPNRAAMTRFMVELDPIAEYVASLDIEEASKSLMLRKIESAKVLLADEQVQFDVILTKIGEILGLMMILAESLPNPDDKKNMWDKVKGFAANFGTDMTVNLLSGAISNAAIGAITA